VNNPGARPSFAVPDYRAWRRKNRFRPPFNIAEVISTTSFARNPNGLPLSFSKSGNLGQALDYEVPTGASHVWFVNGIECMRLNNVGNVGIGTNSPAYQLNTSKVANVSDLGQLVRFTNASVANNYGPFHLTIGTANYWAQNPSPVICGTNGLALGVGDGSDFAAQRKLIIDPFGNVGIGTSNPTYKLTVNGQVKSRGFITDTSAWADYVFAPDIKLPSLNEVEAHIKSKGHLPDVPSESELVSNGLDLGKMSATQMAQIEQLMLHVIALNKQVQAQAEEIQTQAKQVSYQAEEIRKLKSQAGRN
jgi:hypothetical protein